MINKESITSELQSLQMRGVSDDQISELAENIFRGYMHVWTEDPGLDESMVWLKSQLEMNLPSEQVEILSKIVEENQPDESVEYLEEGYDSCQSHRKLAKIVGEAILIGGLLHEMEMLSYAHKTEKVIAMTGTKLSIASDSYQGLMDIAKEWGTTQDFLFPGVTPSPNCTINLENLAVQSLIGKPMTSVRNVTSVGGVRSDKDWNHVTDLQTFTDLKVEEDKRYYPGLGIFYFLSHVESIDEIPLMKELGDGPHTVFAKLQRELRGIEKNDYRGVSILCSAYVPTNRELKEWQGYTLGDRKSLKLDSAFHSPAYELGMLYRLVKIVGKEENSSEISQITSRLAEAAKSLWSFNSTIHLPWTTELAGLSNNMIGKVTNLNGEYAVRYGLGWWGNSLELREYHYTNGSVVYGGYLYRNEEFNGQPDKFIVLPGSKLWNTIEKEGFLKAGLEYIKELE